jgi:polar amino acid transport system permease protein
MFSFLADWSIQRAFLDGLLTTLWLTVVSSALAILLGMLCAFGRLAPMRWLRWPTSAYVAVFRNTPLLIQLYFCYRGLQSVGMILAPETCGVLALSLYTGAYLTEIFRSGLQAIPQEQMDAGLSLGLSRFQVYRMILVPQALRLVLPSIGGQLVSLAKNSSLVAFITVNDLFFVLYKGAVDQFRPVEYFVEGAALYLAVSLAIAGLVGWVERRMSLPSVAPGAVAYG